MILYFCPDATIKSAGIRILYRHVEMLARNEFPAAILHQTPGFRVPDVPQAPIRYASAAGGLSPGDVLVIPEGWPNVMQAVRASAVRKIVIALNWRYPYRSLSGLDDWRTYGVERIITHSSFIGEFLTRAMSLPSHVVAWGIDPRLYYYRAEEKTAQIVFIRRKQDHVEELQRVLQSRNPAFIERIAWKGLHDLAEVDYARELRRSWVFLNLSHAEGLPCSLLKAMRAGTFVAGYNSVGGQRELIGDGERRNCILAENLDYPTLARRLEPLLTDLLAGNADGWAVLRENALAASAPYTPEAEEASVVGLWREILEA